MFGHKSNPDELFSAMMPKGTQRLHVTTTEITLKKVSIPLAGAHAEVEVNRSGLFGRTANTVLTITATDGSAIIYTYGAGFGQSGSASRMSEVTLRKLAAKVNNAAIHATQLLAA